MSDQEINIAIAEVRGLLGPWTEQITPCGCDGQWDLFNSDGVRLPDCCNDLNSMNEATKWISQQCKDSDFWFFLREIIGFPDAESDWDEYYYFQAINATARQRAEAFLRTIGKWENDFDLMKRERDDYKWQLHIAKGEVAEARKMERAWKKEEAK